MTNKTRKHAHYFKDVEHLTEVDVYRVCDIFKVNDPSGATQHAIKKLLLPGQRGAGKDLRKDLKEAADTITRRIEMLDEDEQVQKLTILGMEYTVTNGKNSANSLFDLYRAKELGSTHVHITPELFQRLVDLKTGFNLGERNA